MPEHIYKFVFRFRVHFIVFNLFFIFVYTLVFNLNLISIISIYMQLSFLLTAYTYKVALHKNSIRNLRKIILVMFLFLYFYIIIIIMSNSET